MSATAGPELPASPQERRALLARLLREREQAPIPLSPAQTRLWFLDRLTPGDPTYNIPLAFDLPGALDPDALERAVNEIVRRHDVLRTTFAEAGGQPRQVVAASLTLPVERIDLRRLAPAERAAEAHRIAMQRAAEPFDLARGPLCRVCLLRLDDDAHRLVVVMHHIVSDGASMNIFLEELSALYGAFSTGAPSPLPELGIQYGDFARWQAGQLGSEHLDRQLRYWLDHLDGMPGTIDLPFDRERPPVPTRRGALYAFALEPSLVAGLAAAGRRANATLFMTLLAGFKALLHRYSGEHDIAVGSPITNRGRTELERLIGFFVNSLVLRTSLAGDPTFAELLARVREVALGAYAHQDLPFERLVDALHVERDLGRHPLFQVMFTVHTAAAFPPGAGTAAGAGPDMPPQLSTGTAKFDLSLTISTAGGRANGVFEYATDLFDECTVAGLATRLKLLLRGVAQDPGRRLSQYALVDERERLELLRPRRSPRATPDSLVRAVRARAAAVPDAPALIGQEGAIGYGELVRRVDRLRQRLAALGAGPGKAVAISVGASPEQVVAMLSVLEAGGSFLLLDPADPLVRREAIADHAGASLVIGPGESCEPRPGRPADAGLATGCLAYRSSPSGELEGFLLPERALCATARLPDLEPRPDDRVAHALPGAGEDALFAVAGALAAGAAAVLPEPSAPPRRLAATLRDAGATVLCAPAAAVERLASEFPWALRSVRLILCVDGIGALRGLRRALAPDLLARTFVPYGTAATGGWVAAAALREWPEDAPGLRLSDRGSGALLVLDGALEPVPDGVTGELCVDAPGLAPGLHGDPVRTAAAFVPHPLGRTGGERLHRTGERARRRAGGEIELRPRRQGLVTARGARFALAEVEGVLRECPGVGDAAVAVHGAREGLTALLVAAGDAPPSADAVRAFAVERLPAAMVPSAFEIVAGLPRDPSGVLDRDRLGALLAAGSAMPDAAASTDTERRLAEIWAEVFQAEPPGVHANFFALGGHSLLATRVIARIADGFGVELPLRQIFDTPTIAGLAAVLDQVERDAPAARLRPIERVPRDGPLELSFAQQRLWFLAQLEPDNPFYNIPVALTLKGPTDADALRLSLGDLVERHEALRTSFPVDGDAPVQVIADGGALELPVVDLRPLAPAARRAEVQRLTALEASRAFDLARGPLIRAQLLELGDEDRVLLLTVHHIVADGWSMDVLARDLGVLYEARRAGRPAELPELAVQYADYARWQRATLSGDLLDEQLRYWREQLDGAPAVLELPTDHPRPAVQSFRGAIHGFSVPPPVAERVRGLSESEGATPFMTLLAAFTLLLYRYTGQRDLVVGTPIAGRGRPELEDLIGFFANTLVLRTAVRGELTFRELLARVREVTLGAYAHQDLPFEKLVEELEPERSLARNPLFQVMFVLQSTGRVGPRALRAEHATGAQAGTGVAKFDLTAFLGETDEGFDAALEYNSDLFEPATIARMAAHFERLLDVATAEPDRPIAGLEMFAIGERELMRGWATPAVAPTEPVHRRFEAQARETPGAPAVRCGDRTLTYAELDRRAGALARRLVAAGVTPDSCVGLCLPRSVEQVTGVLGALKAGAAYVPLDPGYPRARLAAMIADAGVRVAIAAGSTVDALAAAGVRIVRADEQDDGGDVSLAIPFSPQRLAYVLYTSGSTGRPKGVAMPHGPLVNLVRWQAGRSRLGGGSRTLQFAPLGFDVASQEILCTLCCGGELVLAGEDERRDPAALLALLDRARVDRLFLPFVALQQLAEHVTAQATALPECLREVITAGEQLQITPEIRACFGGGRRLVNQYGPTETHVVTEHELAGPPSEWPALPPIGRPLPGAVVRVLDADGGQSPVGAWGELHVGGLPQARGYVAQPARTAERFVPDPLAEAGGRLYRTGDRARHLPDGTLEFAGRLDDQVKIRGFRVEPGEVEAALRALEGVRQAAVVAEDARGGGRRLVAYVQPAGNAELAAEELRARLARTLPDYMIPAAFAVLDELPLTASGKLDRRRLPQGAAAARIAGEAFVAPRTPTEAVLAGIWSDLLEVERVGVHDDFFALGGHSLLATRVVARVRDELQRDVPLRALFERPTVEHLALAVLQASLTEADDELAEHLLAELDAMPEEEAQARAAT